jgi:hypothetical protein
MLYVLWLIDYINNNLSITNFYLKNYDFRKNLYIEIHVPSWIKKKNYGL